MFQNAISVFSESIATLAVTCLSFGVLIYFTLHHWHRVAALSRNRSQLLSVGAGIVVVLLAIQLRQSRGLAGTPVSGDDFSAVADPTPRLPNRWLGPDWQWSPLTTMTMRAPAKTSLKPLSPAAM
jgi:hypothetical protein